MPTTAAAKIDRLIDGIANDGYAITPHFLPPETIATLVSDAKKLQEIGEMHRASTGQTGIGHNSSAAADDSIRGDFIHWLEETTISAAQQQYLQRMESLRVNLNQSFYLGLFELESHFAIYPPGAVYRKHLDQFQDNSHRQVSCVLYLNQSWQHEDGGQLRLYLDGENPTPYLDVEPIGGTMIAFLSGRFWHEVLPAKRERMSLTGWFRTRPDEVA